MSDINSVLIEGVVKGIHDSDLAIVCDGDIRVYASNISPILVEEHIRVGSPVRIIGRITNGVPNYDVHIETINIEFGRLQ